MRKDGWVLVNRSGIEINKGEHLTDFRGDSFTLEGGAPPHKVSSTGRVYVSQGKGSMERSLYPTVFELKWVPMFLVQEGQYTPRCGGCTRVMEVGDTGATIDHKMVGECCLKG